MKIKIDPLLLTEYLTDWSIKVNTSFANVAEKVEDLYNKLYMNPDDKSIGNSNEPIRLLSTNQVIIKPTDGAIAVGGTGSEGNNYPFIVTGNNIDVAGYITVTSENESIASFTKLRVSDIEIMDNDISLGSDGNKIEVGINGNVLIDGHTRYVIDTIEGNTCVLSELTKGVIYFTNEDTGTPIEISINEDINISPSSSGGSSDTPIDTMAPGAVFRMISAVDKSVNFKNIIILGENGSVVGSDTSFQFEAGVIYEFILLSANTSDNTYVAAIKK